MLAIFELANCFRQGWGIPKDPIAAKQVGCPIGEGGMATYAGGRRQEAGGLSGLVTEPWLTRLLQYYETAANLGDTGTLPAPSQRLITTKS